MPDTAGAGDLWIRASRLTERCVMTVSLISLPPGWVVRITAIDGVADRHADGMGKHLVEALAAAVGRAEAMGLARAGGTREC